MKKKKKKRKIKKREGRRHSLQGVHVVNEVRFFFSIADLKNRKNDPI